MGIERADGMSGDLVISRGILAFSCTDHIANSQDDPPATFVTPHAKDIGMMAGSI